MVRPGWVPRLVRLEHGRQALVLFVALLCYMFDKAGNPEMTRRGGGDDGKWLENAALASRDDDEAPNLGDQSVGPGRGNLSEGSARPNRAGR